MPEHAVGPDPRDLGLAGGHLGRRDMPVAEPIALLALPLWDAALAHCATIARPPLDRDPRSSRALASSTHATGDHGRRGAAARRVAGPCRGVVAAASIFGHDLVALTAIAVLGLILTLGRVVGNREAAEAPTRLAALSSHLAHRLSDPRRRAVASKNRILVREMEQLCDPIRTFSPVPRDPSTRAPGLRGASRSGQGNARFSRPAFRVVRNGCSPSRRSVIVVVPVRRDCGLYGVSMEFCRRSSAHRTAISFWPKPGPA